MSHMVETLSYAGEVPWHGLGVKLADRVSASEMLRTAGLDWTVEPRPVFVDGNEVAGVKAIVRVPHGNVLKVLTDEYGIVQNAEIAALAEAMSGQGVRAWEVGGSLDEGRRVFFCGKLDDHEVAGDVIRDYLTVASSHDGSLSVTAAFSPIRVVCANTLGAFLNEAEGKPRISIRHTKSASDKVKLATKLCEQARAYFGAFNTEALTMVGRAMSVVEAVELSETLFPKYKSPDTGQIVTPELQTTCIELFKNMHACPQDRRIAGTRWGYYQALTAALDHNRRGSDKSRLARFLTGTDDTLRSRAWKFLTGK